jgi:D-lactate dehydrogenase
MERKIICFGIRDYERLTFESIGKKYGYALVLKKQFLTDLNYQDALGYEIVMIRGNCIVSATNLRKLRDKGLRYYLTRTAGYNHIDLTACKELGIEVAYAPGYSPNAIGELAVTLAMSLLRNVAYAVNETAHLRFSVTDQMFSHEIRECTVGILGCGRIGAVTAGLFKGLGARTIGYDPYPSEKAKEAMTMVTLDELLAQSDIISIHMPYIPERNDKFFGAEKIGKMKIGAILINTARGELLDMEAVANAVEKGRLGGLGIDVIPNERSVFGHDFVKLTEIPDPTMRWLTPLFPKVLITPHIGSATYGALRDMVEISLQNAEEYLTTGQCKNSLIK